MTGGEIIVNGSKSGMNSLSSRRGRKRRYSRVVIGTKKSHRQILSSKKIQSEFVNLTNERIYEKVDSLHLKQSICNIGDTSFQQLKRANVESLEKANDSITAETATNLKAFRFLFSSHQETDEEFLGYYPKEISEIKTTCRSKFRKLQREIKEFEASLVFNQHSNPTENPQESLEKSTYPETIQNNQEHQRDQNAIKSVQPEPRMLSTYERRKMSINLAKKSNSKVIDSAQNSSLSSAVISCNKDGFRGFTETYQEKINLKSSVFNQKQLKMEEILKNDFPAEDLNERISEIFNEDEIECSKESTLSAPIEDNCSFEALMNSDFEEDENVQLKKKRRGRPPKKSNVSKMESSTGHVYATRSEKIMNIEKFIKCHNCPLFAGEICVTPIIQSKEEESDEHQNINLIPSY